MLAHWQWIWIAGIVMCDAHRRMLMGYPHELRHALAVPAVPTSA